MRQQPGESDIPLHGWRPYSEFHQERIRASEKHRGAGDMEVAPWYDERWLPVLVEEVGEVARCLNEDPATRRQDLRAELVQVGAMTAAWIEALDDRTEETFAERAVREGGEGWAGSFSS